MTMNLEKNSKGCHKAFLGFFKAYYVKWSRWCSRLSSEKEHLFWNLLCAALLEVPALSGCLHVLSTWWRGLMYITCCCIPLRSTREVALIRQLEHAHPDITLLMQIAASTVINVVRGISSNKRRDDDFD